VRSSIVRKLKRAMRVKLIMQPKILYFAISIEIRLLLLRRRRSAIRIVVSVIKSVEFDVFHVGFLIRKQRQHRIRADSS